MTTQRTVPRVFLSSTIYDFADLRSSLKFWLEELGYEVNASEYNDFRKDLDLNSYEACLRTIDTSDYFILLIGSRAGGWYDEQAKTTITMQEYRRAYDRAKAGELKIVTFVRKAVWDVREDRRGLASIIAEEFARERGITREDVAKIQNYKSRVVEDAETVFGFLGEVARNAEMKAAVKAGEALPPGNWIHQFSSFRDIVDALRVDFLGTHGLRRVALSANLRAELIGNLRSLIDRSPSSGTCDPTYRWAAPARRAFTGGPLDSSSIEGNHLMWLSLFALIAKASGSLRTQALEEAIVSGEFLDFDRARDRYEVGPLQGALIQLRDEIDRLRREEAALTLEDRKSLVENFRPLKDVKEKTIVENRHLVGVIGVHDRHFNVTELSVALLRAIDGAELALPNLRAGTPFEQEAVQLEQERPSVADVLSWVESLRK